MVILFARNGKVLTPEDFGIHEALNKRPPRDIEPERGDGWTDEEWNQVLYVWNLAYPRLKRIYGWPYCKCGGFLCLGTHKVKITKDPSIGPDGLFISRSTCWANSEIKLKGWENMYGRRWGPIFIHEMAHAFRNYKTIPYNQFEEGHAEFIEVEVSTTIYRETGNFWDYPFLYHNDEFTKNFNYHYPFLYGSYSFFQQYNTDFLRVGAYLTVDEFWINRDLTALRYRIAGFSWWKLWFRVYDFFQQFNSIIYDLPSGLPYSTYKSIARSIVGSTRLEDNLPFDDWWQTQHALRGDVTITNSFSCSSTSLGLVATPFRGNDLNILIYLYWRRRSGFSYVEEAVPSWVDVRLMVKDHYGRKVLDTIINMNGYRSQTVEINSLDRGTYKIHAYPRACPDLFQERVVFHPGGNFSNIVDSLPDLTFIALVGSEPTDSIVVRPTYLVHGATDGYYIHEWPIKRARYTVYDSAHTDRWSLIIKDEAPYIVYPGGWKKVPPGQPQNVRVLSKDAVSMVIGWVPNDEVDMYRYKFVWTSYDTSSTVNTGYRYTTDTTVTISPINGANCIMYKVNVYAIDRGGNISGRSNTVIDGWWDESVCGPPPLAISEGRGKSGEIVYPTSSRIKVYDATGRLIYEGGRKGFKPQRRGVFFIYENGEVNKEVLR